MSDEARIRAYYDDFSRNYDDPRGGGYHRLIDDLTVSLIGPATRGAEVLEIGCGTGLLLSRVAPGAARAVGVDLSPGMLAHARERGLDVHEGRAEALPFEDASFDVVYSFKVLAHVPDLDAAFAEAARVTRPHGRLFLEVYNRHSLRYLARRIVGDRKIGQSHDEGDVPTRWDVPDDVVRRLPSNLRFVGFRGIRVLTPAARAISLPFVGPALVRAEGRLMRSSLARYGGFLVLELERRPDA